MCPLRLRTILGVITALCLSACTDSTILHSYHNPSSPQGWLRLDTICFDIPAQEQDLNVNMSMCMRISNGFPYQHLWVVIDQQWEDSLCCQQDTICFRLVNENEELNGQGFTLLQYEQHISPLTLREGVAGQLRVRHIMTREMLPYVHDIGIRLTH